MTTRTCNFLGLFVLVAIASFVTVPANAASNTTTTVAASSATVTLGDTVTFTATVTPNAGTGTPTGLVTFFDGTTPLGSGTLNGTSGNDQATFSTAALIFTGAHSITAIYDGDANFAASAVSSPITETVQARDTTTTLVVNPAAVAIGQQTIGSVTVADAGTSAPPGTPNSFSPTGTPATGRTGFTITAFSDRDVLVAGGTDANGNVLQSAEIYNISGAGFNPAKGNLNTARTGAVAVLLSNGKVLVAGGSSDGTANGALNTAEIFDPVTGTFTLAGSGNATNPNQMIAARVGHTATVLFNGKVLLAGGENSGGVLNSAELYDPATDTFTATGNLNVARSGAGAGLVTGLVTLGTFNSHVLIAGGSSDGTANGALDTVEIFSISTTTGAGTFQLNGPRLSDPRWQPEAVALDRFTILIAGGQNSTGTLTSADRFTTQRFIGAVQSRMAVGRANGSAVLLPNGTILFVGGANGSQQAELLNLSTDIFETAASLPADNGLLAQLLSNGQVLTVGLTSSTSAADAELYTLSFNPRGSVNVSSAETGDGLNSGCELAVSAGTTSACLAPLEPVKVGSNPHVLTANPGTSSATANLTVNPGATSTSIGTTGNPSFFGDVVTLTATVTNNSSPNSNIAPAGTVQFVVDGVNFGSPVPLAQTIFNRSTAAVSTSTLNVSGSPHSVTANYLNADGNFVNSTNLLPGGQPVIAVPTSAVVASSAPSSSFGQGVNFTATISNSGLGGSTGAPTGSVQFVVDGQNFGAPVTLAASGSNTSTATSGNIATLPVNGGTPHTVGVNYTNTDQNFTNSTGQLSGGQTVNAVPTATAVASSLASATYGQGVNFIATISNGGSASTASPTGSVQFVVDGQNFGAPVTLTAGTGSSSTATSGTIATLMVNAGSPHAVVVNYTNSDHNFINSNGSLSGGLKISPAPLTVTANNPTTTYNNAVFSGFSATLSGLVNGETEAGLRSSGALSGTAAFTGLATSAINAGVYVIVPTQGTLAANNYVFTNFANGALTILKANITSATTLAATPVNDPVNGGALSFVTAVTSTTGGTPTGFVQFTDDKNNLTAALPLNVATCSPGTPATTACAKFSPAAGQLAVGAQTITAIYQGDINFLNGVPSPAQVTLVPAISTRPGQPIPPQLVTFDNAGALAGQNITLGCEVQAAAIPASAQFPTCSLSSTSLPPSGSVTVSLSTVSGASAGITGTPTTVFFAHQGGNRLHRLSIAALCLPGIGLLGLVLATGSERRKRRLLGPMLMLSILLLVVGCGGHATPPPVVGGTPAGTYLVSLVGTDANHNQVVAATIPLNVQ
jgi:hypothetical protein